MKNNWIVINAAGEMVRMGTGEVPPLLPGESFEWHDQQAGRDQSTAVTSYLAIEAARDELSNAKLSNRMQAFIRKEICAREFLQVVFSEPDKLLKGAAGLALINPVLFAPLYKEYEATHHLIDMTPRELAQAIVDKADAPMDAEVARRVAILEAEQLLEAQNQ